MQRIHKPIYLPVRRRELAGEEGVQQLVPEARHICSRVA
jgi:hypothetical protein